MRYRVSLKKNWLCYLACGLMLLSAALRLGHFIPRWGETGWFMLATQLFVPLLANVVFCYGALKKGGYLITVLSVFLGVLFFIIKAQGFEHAWHTILCTLLYLLVFILYTITALGVVFPISRRLPRDRAGVCPALGLPHRPGSVLPGTRLPGRAPAGTFRAVHHGCPAGRYLRPPAGPFKI